MVQLAVSVSSSNNESLVMMLLVRHAIARLRLGQIVPQLNGGAARLFQNCQTLTYVWCYMRRASPLFVTGAIVSSLQFCSGCSGVRTRCVPSRFALSCCLYTSDASFERNGASIHGLSYPPS